MKNVRIAKIITFICVLTLTRDSFSYIVSVPNYTDSDGSLVVQYGLGWSGCPRTSTKRIKANDKNFRFDTSNDGTGCCISNLKWYPDDKKYEYTEEDFGIICKDSTWKLVTEHNKWARLYRQ